MCLLLSLFRLCVYNNRVARCFFVVLMLVCCCVFCMCGWFVLCAVAVDVCWCLVVLKGLLLSVALSFGCCCCCCVCLGGLDCCMLLLLSLWLISVRFLLSVGLFVCALHS